MKPTLRHLILLLCLTLTACEPTPSAPASQAPTPAGPSKLQPSKFRLNFTETPTSLDPLKASSAYSGAIISNVYDTLYRYQLFAEPYALMPNLAAAIPEVSADGKTVRIRLRQDAYFQDSAIFPGGKGRQVQAADVVFSLKRHFVPANFSDGAWLWSDAIAGLPAWVKSGAKMSEDVIGLQALAPDLLEIRLTQPMPMLASTLANAYSAVVPHEAISHFGADIARQALGSGPFLLASFDGAKAVLKRNPNFRKETFNLAAEGFDPNRKSTQDFADLNHKLPPFTEVIEINFLSEPSTVHLAFTGGALEMAGLNAPMLDLFFAARAPLTLRPEFAETLRFREIDELGSVFVSFNMLDPALGASSDPALNTRHQKLRCAISQAYNWQERSDKIYRQSARLFRGVIPPNVAGFDPANTRPSFDLKLAKQLLAEAGYDANNLPTLKFGSTAGSEQRRTFELFRSQMLDLGFSQEQIQWQSFPSFGAYIEAVNRGEVMLMDMGWQFDAPDAENILQLYYGPYKAPQVNNANYQNAVFDADFLRIRSMAQGPERLQIMQRMNQQLIDDCVVISGASRRIVSVWRKPWRAWPDNAMMAGRMLRFVAPATAAPATAAPQAAPP
jgi:oligopeptide transport system substrate-binding protein